MLQAPRIVRWTLPALLLTLVVGGAIIVAVSGRDSGPKQAVKGSSAPDATKPTRRQRAARRVTVHGGDTATSIAQHAKLTLLELLELNPNVDPRALRPGQKLKISR
jgi:LysM repeat protein